MRNKQLNFVQHERARTIFVVGVSGGARRIARVNGGSGSVAFSPDGRRGAYWRQGGLYVSAAG